MRVESVAPDLDLRQLLPGSRFIDTYEVVVPDTGQDARVLAERILGRSPPWASTLLALREGIVAPLGLKTARTLPDGDRIGFFPVIDESPARVVAGFDDHHLDFRVLIDVAPVVGGQRIRATTVVLTHNRMGRAYLALVLPFHRLIVPAMLRQVGE